ncbi:MAG: hypothetical protein A3H96_20290 [Acidobacteria bacterium RIFCSPLOWO2_02_FULL_67_36]|nr:MAG: hypothetical protein A3H96_20290 [Acidobacteria bacterium RIFCSPLOWO2_02_FULL_67_36]OFW23373.1 MAG: hypothetical protein A3G21_10795 [Acidobacteria bacterium RIFCSPLOWO2_12_FULL_66_21]
MNTWQEILRDVDPAGERLAPDESARIRRHVMAAARERATDARVWPRPLALAAVVLAMVAAGALFAERQGAPPQRVTPPPQTGERRQLQFDTPGGTRIIWIFNSEFDLKATNP